MGSLQRYSSTVLAERAEHAFYADETFAEAPIGDRPLAEIEMTVEQAKARADQIPAHRFNRFYQRIVAEAVYDRGIPAAEEKREALCRIIHLTIVAKDHRRIRPARPTANCRHQ